MAERKTHDQSVPAAKIEISLSRLGQLFNSLDPSPFHERDLDQDAEEYIIGSAEEISAPSSATSCDPSAGRSGSGDRRSRSRRGNSQLFRLSRKARTATAARVVPGRSHRLDYRAGVSVLLRAVSGTDVFLGLARLPTLSVKAC